MRIIFKDNNIFYYDYKVFDGKLSLILIPLALIILIKFKSYIKYVSYIFICISIIGIIDSYLYYLEDNRLLLLILFVVLFHSILLYPLKDIKKYFEPSIINLIFFIFSLIIVYYMPYWPYKLTKINVYYLLIGIHIILLCYYILCTNYLEMTIKKY